MTDESLRRRQPISFASYRASVFCSGCNAHFKHLEDAVIPLLVPMARGRALSLGPKSQALLACWAHKTAIALVAAGDDGFQPPAHHAAAVRDGDVAGDDTRVGFFHWRGGPVVGTAKARVQHRGVMSTTAGYVAFLAFAEVGFRVLAFDGSLPGHDGGSELAQLVQFWPAQNRLVNWPPAATTDNRIVPALLRC